MVNINEKHQTDTSGSEDKNREGLVVQVHQAKADRDTGQSKG